MILDTEGMKLKPGDRVLLVGGEYHAGQSNPYVGSDWECEGTFTGSSNVKWDNGHGNTYSNHTLKRADGCVSIWEYNQTVL